MGSTTPVTAGDYELYGSHDGQDTFRSDVTSRVLWYDSMDYNWKISGAAGTEGAEWHEHTVAQTILGSYEPQGTATGTAVVSVTP